MKTAVAVISAMTALLTGVASGMSSAVVQGGPRGDGGGCCTRAQEVPWRVWPLGDSITLGRTVIDGQATDGVGGYRAKLPSKLTIKYELVGSKSDAWGPNDGWSGWRADQIVGKVRTWAIWAKPNVVLLHVGTNDLGAGDTAEQLWLDIQTIVNEIRAEGYPRIFVAKLPPIPLNSAAQETQRRRFNDGLAAKVVEWGKNILVVDQTDVPISTDGVHPSEPAGYEAEATHWAAQLNKLPHLLG